MFDEFDADDGNWPHPVPIRPGITPVARAAVLVKEAEDYAQVWAGAVELTARMLDRRLRIAKQFLQRYEDAARAYDDLCESAAYEC